MSKHKWANEIIAWANGTQIEELAPTSGRWMLVFNPSWAGPTSFRIYDPYRELKEAKERGETIQLIGRFVAREWTDDPHPTWVWPPDQYRIKPREPREWFTPEYADGGTGKNFTEEEMRSTLRGDVQYAKRWIKVREVIE